MSGQSGLSLSCGHVLQVISGLKRNPAALFPQGAQPLRLPSHQEAALGTQHCTVSPALWGRRSRPALAEKNISETSFLAFCCFLKNKELLQNLALNVPSSVISSLNNKENQRITLLFERYLLNFSLKKI